MHSFFYDWDRDTGQDYFTINTYYDLTFPLHMHRTFELVYLCEGTMKMWVEGQEYELEAGDMLLVKSNYVHSTTTDTSSCATYCIFAPELIGAVSSQFKQHPLTSPVVRNVPSVYRELFVGVSESSSICRIKGLLYSVCELFYGKLDLSREEVLMGRGRLLREVFKYIEQNIQTPCALTTVADELGYSASYLSRAFNTMVGIPYTAYVRNVRINHACYLLRNTNDKIADIVSQCGYTSAATFYHNFKELIGCGPTEYRQRKGM